jgi:hypothetical protein
VATATVQNSILTALGGGQVMTLTLSVATKAQVAIRSISQLLGEVKGFFL